MSNGPLFINTTLDKMHYRLKDATGLLLDGTYHVNHIIGRSRGCAGCTAPLWDPILSFSHTFSPKSAHVGGPCPPNGCMPPLWEILDPPLHIKKGSAHSPLGIADKFDTYKKAFKNTLLNKFAIETLNNELQEVTLQDGSKEPEYLPGTIMDYASMHS